MTINVANVATFDLNYLAVQIADDLFGDSFLEYDGKEPPRNDYWKTFFNARWNPEEGETEWMNDFIHDRIFDHAASLFYSPGGVV
jgi:hypothetical protein